MLGRAKTDLQAGSKVSFLFDIFVIGYNFTNSREKCWDEPRQVCENIPKMVCKDVPKEKCWDEPRQECRDVPREECRDVPREYTDYFALLKNVPQ